MSKKEQLVSSLHSKEESERLYAVEDILDLGIADMSIELLNQLKVERSSVIKNSIVSVLQKMEHSPAYPIIFDLFQSKDAFMRNAAVAIFASYTENAVTFLSSYLDHSDKEVRKLILDSLVDIATKRSETKNSVVDIFRACLHDPAINVVITAIEYLGRLGDRSALEDMIPLYQRINEPMLRSTILDCILKIGEKEDFEKTLSTLFEDINSADSLYIPQVMRLLARSGKKDEFLQLVQDKQRHSNFTEDILASIDWLIKEEGIAPTECVPILKEIANTEKLDDDMRIICVTLLLASNDTDAIEFVREWSSKGSIEFQSYCMESIGKESHG
jgi:hypothetical protein